MNVLETLAGPLAAPACRRALSRRWMPWVRGGGAALVALALLVIGWIWWLAGTINPGFRPSMLLEIGSTATLVLLVVGALLMTPAMLAGSLAGKDRGTLALLLTSRVSPWEIVAARLVSQMAVVVAVLLGGLPVLAALFGWMGLRPGAMLIAAALPLAVALGCGGIALAASAVARRGRDALMAVYLLDLALLLAPALGREVLPSRWWEWLAAFNPFGGIFPLVAQQDAGPALASVAAWSALGVLGVAFAGLRLVPIYVKQLEGGRPRRRHRRKFTFVGLADRPMLWKELHTELAGKRGWIVRGLGILAVAVMLGASALLIGLTLARREWPLDERIIYWHDLTKTWIAASSLYLSWLIQWAVALRASVAIASEREGDTWDTLLTTPLEGSEIVWSKIGGSLYALRGLLAVAVISWTTALICDALQPSDYWIVVGTTFVVGAFMAAVGVWASLVAGTATRAMTITLATWLVGGLAVGMATLFLMALGAVALLALWAFGIGTNIFTTASGPFRYISFGGAWFTIRLSLFALAAVGIGWYCRRSFDPLAGRAHARRAWTPRFAGPQYYNYYYAHRPPAVPQAAVPLAAVLGPLDGPAPIAPPQLPAATTPARG